MPTNISGVNPFSILPNYGIDGPVVLRNLVLIVIGAVAVGLVAGLQLLPIRPAITSILFKLAIFITLFNLACLVLSLWSSKIGKIREAQRLLDTYEWRGDERVLDVGCGRGLMLIAAAKRLDTGKAMGLDIWDSRDQSGNRPESTFENARIEGVSDLIEVMNGDARHLPFENNSFDVVLSSKALHNIINPEERKKAVREIARVVKPGGWLGIIDSFQYAKILQDIGWVSAQASARRFQMFPPVKWTTGVKSNSFV